MASNDIALTNSTTSALVKSAQDTYLNANSLNSVKTLGKENKSDALKEISKKFESMFLQQVLKSMRDANEVFEDGDLFSSDQVKFHQEMMDQQLVLNLTSGQGIGIAKHLYQQMLNNAGIKPADSDKKINGINFPAKTDSNIAPLNKPSADSRGVGSKSSIAETANDFIATIKPYAEKAAQELNVGVDVILAQAALETGWGKNLIHDAQGNNSFNIFNIKAAQSSTENSVAVNSLEYVKGVAQKVQSKFKTYSSYANSFNDYVDLIKNNPRYQKQLTQVENSKDYADALQKAGYATDPRYAEKIKHLLQHQSIQSVSSESPTISSTPSTQSLAAATDVSDQG